jgi:hypothetical protein
VEERGATRRQPPKWLPKCLNPPRPIVVPSSDSWSCSLWKGFTPTSHAVASHSCHYPRKYTTPNGLVRVEDCAL